MKKVLFILLILVFCLSFFVYKQNNSPEIIISNLLKTGQLKSGELKYRIYLLGVLPVGEAVFGIEKIEEYRGKQVYHANVTAKSLEFLAKIFQGSAVLDSYISLKDLNPLTFKQKLVVSGKDDVDREATYDQKNGIMTIAGIERTIFPNTQDPLSAIFNIRHTDFNKVRNLEMNINTNQKNYILKGAVIKEESIRVNQNSYKIIVAKSEIARRDKNPYHKSKITMTLLKDYENLPILIKVFASGILINAKLIEMK